jgi:hypothetical protein
VGLDKVRPTSATLAELATNLDQSRAAPYTTFRITTTMRGHSSAPV